MVIPVPFVLGKPTTILPASMLQLSFLFPMLPLPLNAAADLLDIGDMSIVAIVKPTTKMLKISTIPFVRLDIR